MLTFSFCAGQPMGLGDFIIRVYMQTKKDETGHLLDLDAR